MRARRFAGADRVPPLDRADLRCVGIAGCPSEPGEHKDALAASSARYAPGPKGRLLSLRAAADEGGVGTCASLFGKASPSPQFKEVTVSAGPGHAAFAGGEIEWLRPIVDWLREG